MAFHAVAFTAGSYTATWPTTSPGDDVYAWISVDDDPGETFTPPTGWTQVGTTQTSTFDGQVFAFFHYMGNSGGGAPASPPTTDTWSSTPEGASGNCCVCIASWSGRAIGSLTFNTISNTNTGSAFPVSAGLTGGTAAAGDDIAVFCALDGNFNGNTFTDSTTGSPGTFSNHGVGGTLTNAPSGLSTIDNVSAGATGTLTSVFASTQSNQAAWTGWVISIAAASSGNLAGTASCSFGASATPSLNGKAAVVFGAVVSLPSSGTASAVFGAHHYPPGTVLVGEFDPQIYAKTQFDPAMVAGGWFDYDAINLSPTAGAIAGVAACVFGASGTPSVQAKASTVFAASGNPMQPLVGTAPATFGASATVSGTAVPGIYYIGTSTVPYNADPPITGPDGSVPNYYNGTSWALMPFDYGNPSSSGSFLTSACYDQTHQRLYGFGNTDGRQYSCYFDLVGQTWVKIADLPGTMSLLATGGAEGYASCIGTKCWIFGGLDGSANSYDTIYSYDTTQTLGSDVYVLQTATLPNPAGDVVGCDDGVRYIYVGGGTNNEGTITAQNQWGVFDTTTATYSALSTTGFTPVAGSACLMLDADTILVVGGTITGQAELTGNTLVQQYKISTNTWSSKNAFPVSACFGRMTNYNGAILCAPGWNSSGFSFSSANQSNEVYVYNRGADSWSVHSTLTTTMAGSGLFAVPATGFGNLASVASCTFGASCTPSLSATAAAVFGAIGARAGLLIGTGASAFAASATPSLAVQALCTFGAAGALSELVAGVAPTTFAANATPSLGVVPAVCTFAGAGALSELVTGTAACAFAATGSSTSSGAAACTFAATGALEELVAGVSACSFGASATPALRGTASCLLGATGSAFEGVAGNAPCVFGATATATVAGAAQCVFAGTGNIVGGFGATAVTTFAGTGTASILGSAACVFGATAGLSELVAGVSTCAFAANASPTVAGTAPCLFATTGALEELVIGTASCVFGATSTPDVIGLAPVAFGAVATFQNSIAGSSVCAFALAGYPTLTGSSVCAFNASGAIAASLGGVGVSSFVAIGSTMGPSIAGVASCVFSANGFPNIAGSEGCAFGLVGFTEFTGTASCVFGATGTAISTSTNLPYPFHPPTTRGVPSTQYGTTPPAATVITTLPDPTSSTPRTSR